MKSKAMNRPSCHSRGTQLIGENPADDRFAGVVLFVLLQGGRLYKCEACHLYFRYPRLSKNELDDLYINGSKQNWEIKSDIRNDWEVAADWIRKKLGLGDKILDVGCSDGGFLEFLGNGYRRFGIEINEGARELARAKDIVMVGNNFDALDKMIEKYDAVTAIDIIEHVQNPYLFLVKLSRVVREGGVIIVSSGDTESLTWRMAKNRYYYCVNAEHISFINARWCRYVSSKLGLELMSVRRFSHSKAGLLQRASEFGKSLIYVLFPPAARWLRSQGFGDKNVNTHKDLLDHPPSYTSAKDHLAVLFKK
jgi:2-polyprenyl-3-methyl-5-hydroxy-6-metoxy-1,4-benzoquinol methylase